MPSRDSLVLRLPEREDSKWVYHILRDKASAKSWRMVQEYMSAICSTAIPLNQRLGLVALLWHKPRLLSNTKAAEGYCENQGHGWRAVDGYKGYPDLFRLDIFCFIGVWGQEKGKCIWAAW